MNNNNYIGFIYRIDYIGNNEIIKNLSYAGSKKITSKLKWEKYFGSPSKKNCLKCLEWKKESKINPENFKKEIICFIEKNESIIQKEIEYLKSVSNDIINDEKWLNSSIPKIGAFPEFRFSRDAMKKRECMRKNTILIKTGNEHGFFINLNKRRNTCLIKYNVDHYNKTQKAKNNNSLHKIKYFSKMTEKEKKLHGLKSLKGRKKENIIAGSIKSTKTRNNFNQQKKDEIEKKRKQNWYKSISNRTKEKAKYISEIYSRNSKLFQKQLYVTIKHLDTGIIESDFIKNWIKKGFARDGINDRVKNNSQKVLFSRKCKKHIIVISHTFISLNDLSLVV